jgi:hypothetical protein
MIYPENFLRGIPNSNFLDEYNYPTSDLFYFKKKSGSENRSDGYLEESINWQDDSGAFETLFSQKKDNDTIQFKAGAAVLSKNEFDRLMNKPTVKGQLSYERAEIPGNKYHGNMLLKSDVPDRVMKKIAASIATTCVSEIIKNPFTS